MMSRLLSKSYRKHGRPEWFRQFLVRKNDERIARLPFYRINPYRGRMSLQRVDHACVVDAQHAVFFHRIAKNANSSLVTSVWQLLHATELSGDIKDKRKLKKIQVTPSALTQAEAQAVDGYFKFFVVRNPYDRILSSYLSKVARPAKLGKPSKLYGGYEPVREIPSFAQFCEILAQGALYRNHHWIPQVDYLVFPKERYNLIARLESINADFDLLASKLGRPSGGSGMVAEDPKHKTDASARRQEFYTDALYEIVYNLYRADFDAFGYDKFDR